MEPEGTRVTIANEKLATWTHPRLEPGSQQPAQLSITQQVLDHGLCLERGHPQLTPLAPALPLEAQPLPQHPAVTTGQPSGFSS